MQALLLAAGQSKRFQPLGDKNFFQLGGKFLIERQVETLHKAGVEKVIFVANKSNLARIKKLFPRAEVVEQKNLAEGMRGAVLAAEKFLTSPTLILSTNDVVDAAAVKKVAGTKGGDGALLAQKVGKYFPGGYLKVGRGRIFSIVEKPPPGREPSQLVSIVCHFFRQPAELLRELKKVSNKKDDGYERALAQLFKKQKFLAVENPGRWRPVKYPWHALDLLQDFLGGLKRKISPQARIAKTAILEGNVVVEAGAKILDYAVVKNSFIGRNAVVGSHSLVRDSQLAANAVVGSGSELARSYVGENSWLHRNYVGDSILAENVGLGSGAVCANLRLDEEDVHAEICGERVSSGRNKFGCAIGKNCRIGVNTCLMPGVLVGANSFVGSGLVVENNVSEKTFLAARGEIKSVENKKVVSARSKFGI